MTSRRRGRVERVSKRFERFAQAFKGGIRGHKNKGLTKTRRGEGGLRRRGFRQSRCPS
jgi:hypothetical protein